MKCNPLLLQLRCSACACVLEAPGEFLYNCVRCGPAGTLEMLYDYPKLAAAWARLTQGDLKGMARYASWLPIRSAASLPPLLVGDTPLSRVDRLAAATGLDHLWIKEDQRNPTGSFKDRASAAVIAAARDRNIQLITAASTGNAASSLAGLGASVGLRTVIFVPASAPEAKIIQLLIYGAEVLLVDGTYDDAFELSLEATRQFGWFNRNTGYNPVTLEGKKTVSLEIFEQLPQVDAVFVSVGDGCIISGIGKGFQDLYRAGLLAKVPRLYGVQAVGSSVLSKAHERGYLEAEPKACTYADSICVGEPRVAHQALQLVKGSSGGFITVSDDQIRTAQLQLARTSGIFAEPAGAAAVAGLVPALQAGLIAPHEKVVGVVTGHGLKDIRGALSAVQQKACHISSQPSRLADELRKAGVV
ncbi:threonine synthase [bacterium]|nr:threonine synthase [bacterium]